MRHCEHGTVYVIIIDYGSEDIANDNEKLKLEMKMLILFTS